MVISDIHVPYQDNNAVSIALQYAKDYKPNHLVINGDLLDFYSLSTFDKSPDRKYSVWEEVQEGRQILQQFRKAVGPKTKMYFTEGNHEQRLQRYLARNPELADMPDLRIDKLLKLKEMDIKFAGVGADYWATATGHIKIGDAIVMHGDNRFNGAATSANSGYSAMNTLKKMQSSVIMGHVHRVAQVHHSTPYGMLTGIEGGCLCEVPGTANWQQGFVTFEVYKGKNKNYRLHQIQHGELITDKKIYRA